MAGTSGKTAQKKDVFDVRQNRPELFLSVRLLRRLPGPEHPTRRAAALLQRGMPARALARRGTRTECPSTACPSCKKIDTPAPMPVQHRGRKKTEHNARAAAAAHVRAERRILGQGPRLAASAQAPRAAAPGHASAARRPLYQHIVRRRAAKALVRALYGWRRPRAPAPPP